MPAAYGGRWIDPEELSDPANSLFLKLHQELAEELILEKLLRLCMLLRTYDDIVGRSPHAERYAEHVKRTSGDDIGYIDCQSASNIDPVSASNFDPFKRWVLVVVVPPSELAGVSETGRARVV